VLGHIAYLTAMFLVGLVLARRCFRARVEK